jgi:hypothetical protein
MKVITNHGKVLLQVPMKRFALLLVALALLVPASSAMANGNPTSSTYSSLNGLGSNASPSNTVTVGSAAAGTGSGSGPSTGATAQSTLPFTGLDVLLLAAGGGSLLGAGLVVRRLSRGVN